MIAGKTFLFRKNPIPMEVTTVRLWHLVSFSFRRNKDIKSNDMLCIIGKVRIKNIILFRTGSLFQNCFERKNNPFLV